MNFGNAITLIRTSFNAVIDTLALTANRTYNLPNKSGTIALLDDIPVGGGGASFSETLFNSVNRTLISSDVNKFILCQNTADITIFVPDDTVTIPINSEIEITRDSTGKVFVERLNTNVFLAGDARANIRYEILSQHQTVTIKKIAANSWRIYGSLAW